MARTGRAQPNRPIVVSNTGRLGTFTPPSGSPAIVVSDVRQRRQYLRRASNVTTIINASVEVLTGAQPGTHAAVVVNVTTISTAKRLFSQQFNVHSVTRNYATLPFAVTPSAYQPANLTAVQKSGRLVGRVVNRILQRNLAPALPSTPTPGPKVILAVQHRSRLLSRTRVPPIVLHNGPTIPAALGTQAIVVQLDVKHGRIRTSRSRVSIITQSRGGSFAPPGGKPQIFSSSEVQSRLLRQRWKSVAITRRNTRVGPLWQFPSPQIVRSRLPLEPEPVFSLWTRVKRDIPSTVIQISNGTWQEWSGAWPSTENPRNKFLFGPQGFNTMGSNQSAFDTPKRLYIGGHAYIIDNILADELRNAVTPLAPTGYDAYIQPAPAGSVYTGDEIILSGYGFDSPLPHPTFPYH